LTYLTLLPLLLVRPPGKLDTFALHWLQENTTWLASRVLEALRRLHLHRGNIIELPDRPILVEEACSRVQSLFTVLFLAAFIVCWDRRSLLQTCLLFAAGFLFAGGIQLVVQHSLADDENSELAQSLLTRMLADATANA
jgi:hypothetical protein